MNAQVRILVIEDDPSIQEFMSMALQDEGYEVKVAANGAVALQLLNTFQPDLILLDMLMPIMDGKAFLEKYHQLPASRAPIIALSASRNLKSIVKPLGVNDFLGKPFDLDELLGCVAKHLRDSRSANK
jgi:two-component system, OmpR family, response regulator